MASEAHPCFFCFISVPTPQKVYKTVPTIIPALQEMLEQEPRAAWARLRLGLHHLCLNRPRDAIADLQASLGMEPNSAEAWEALGAAYESVGRLQAALKVYERAVEIDDSRVFALTQVTIQCYLAVLNFSMLYSTNLIYFAYTSVNHVERTHKPPCTLNPVFVFK